MRKLKVLSALPGGGVVFGPQRWWVKRPRAPGGRRRGVWRVHRRRAPVDVRGVATDVYEIQGRGSQQASIDLFQEVLDDLVSEGEVRKLCQSMPSRLAKCIERKGYHIGY